MKSSFTFTRTRIIAILFTLCVIGSFLIACTWNANAQNTPIKQPTTTQKTPLKVSCGTVKARQGEPPVIFNAQAATEAEACFWQSYQQCQEKTLIFHQMGVDMSVDDTLWPIKQNGACLIADQSINSSVPVRRGNHSFFTTCAQLQKTQQGLLLSACGKKGDLLVPAPTSNS